MNRKTPKSGTKGPSELFDRSFDDASELLDAEEQLKEAQGVSFRASLQKRKDKKDAWLRRRTERNQELNKLASQYVDLHGGEVNNIADLLDYLRKNGMKIVLGKSSGPEELTERAARLHLKKVFGIEGKRGRKPRQI